VSIKRQRAVSPLAQLDTTTSANPARQAISGLVSTIYKATASFQTVDATLPPLWQALLKLDLAGVQSAIRAGQDLNQRSSSNDTPMLHIAREGHYKYPPGEIPALLVQSGADLEAKDNNGRTALQVSLLSGWQNIAELLLKNGAKTDGVAGIKGQVTCPDCKRIIAEYNL